MSSALYMCTINCIYLLYFHCDIRASDHQPLQLVFMYLLRTTCSIISFTFLLSPRRWQILSWINGKVTALMSNHHRRLSKAADLHFGVWSSRERTPDEARVCLTRRDAELTPVHRDTGSGLAASPSACAAILASVIRPKIPSAFSQLSTPLLLLPLFWYSLKSGGSAVRASLPPNPLSGVPGYCIRGPDE